MSNLEYSFVVQELEPVIGKHFGRIRKISEGRYRIKIGSVEILCEVGVRLHPTRYMDEPGQNDQLVEKISKELANSRLRSVKQINNDRIISFDFEKASLIFEMFGKGNIILVKDGKTVCAYRYESWSDREIKAHNEYKAPKSNVADKLPETDKYVIVAMMKLPLGKDYSAEILERLQIDEKTPVNKLTEEQISSINNEIKKITEAVKPRVYYRNGKPCDISLAPLIKYPDLESKEFAAFGDAADEYYANVETTDPRMEKLRNRLEKQEQRLALLQEQEKKYKQTADYIYEHYDEIKKHIDDAKKGKFPEKTNKKEKSMEIEV